MDAGTTPRGGLYRPRAPRQSPLYRCVARHAGELLAAGGARRRIERDTLERFLECNRTSGKRSSFLSSTSRSSAWLSGASVSSETAHSRCARTRPPAR